MTDDPSGRVASSRTTSFQDGSQLHRHYNSSGVEVGTKYSPGKCGVSDLDIIVLFFKFILLLLNPLRPLFYVALTIIAVCVCISNYNYNHPDCHATRCDFSQQLKTEYRVYSAYDKTGNISSSDATELQKSLPNLQMCGGTNVWKQSAGDKKCYTNSTGSVWKDTFITKRDREFMIIAGKDCEPPVRAYGGIVFMKSPICKNGKIEGRGIYFGYPEKKTGQPS
ncbi:hypothetical protein [uncultured Methylobacterium sp.]|uniref:hypothetical protein n=1 Tax=uncultured Methylobacterium sp. TaxID=157278 RepID=UPI0035CC2B10